MNRRGWYSGSLLAATLAATAAAGCDADDAPEGGFQVEVHGASHEFILKSDIDIREGPNEFDLEVEPSDGSSLDAAASVSVIARMSAMTHGEQTAGVTRIDGSTFAVEDVVFPMPGTWELEVSVEEGAGIDRATFKLDVP